MAKKSMRLSAQIVGIAALLASCSKPVPSDGFKDLKYGMTVAELKGHGFDCKPNEGMCERSESLSGGEETKTLFGKDTTIWLDVNNGRLANVSVSVYLSDDELVALYTKQYGKPKTFDLYNPLVGRGKSYYWLSRAGTSIEIISAENAIETARPSSSVSYQGIEATRRLIERAKGKSVDEADV